MMYRKSLVSALLAAGLIGACASHVQAQLTAEATVDFKKANPRAKFFEKNGVVTMVYGTSISTGTSPLDSVNQFLSRWETMFGKGIGQLVPAMKDDGTIVQGVMYQPDKGTWKFHVVRYQQQFAGLPVFRSGAGFLVRNEPDHPVVLTGFDVKDLDGFDVLAGGPVQAKVTDAMLKNVTQLMDAPETADDEEAVSVLETPVPASDFRKPINPIRLAMKGLLAPPAIQTSGEQLVVWAGINNLPEPPRVALKFIAQRGSVQTYPDYDKYLIVADAKTGEILLAENQIHGVDVTGTVQGRATQGLAAAECDPEVAVGLPYAEVSIAGGATAFADANGDFVIPHGGSSPVTVTSRLRGQWFEVFDQSAGNTTPEISMTVTPPGPANFLHNPNPNVEADTANVNAYVEANVVRDYVLTYEPAFPVIATQTGFDVNTNIGSTCNAFYDGSSINFFVQGGGCNNTAFSDVVYHEYGHHLINVTGNGQGQMGEGTGDVVGVLIQDDPILGQGFTGNCSAGIRTADNTKQYPCSGAIHDCGQLLSGCVWDTRNELVLTEPSSYGDISAALFFGMLIVRGQTQPGNSTIDPSITVIYLELDDDDADIGNGTPHYNEIATGFGLHNMDAPPLDVLDFQYPQGRPELISPAGGVAFTVQINDNLGTYQTGTATLHVDNGGGFQSYPMNEVSNRVFEADFPVTQCATEIRYYISAVTTDGVTQNDPGDAPNGYFVALSADATVDIFVDDFESNQGWSVSGDASDGQWDRGVPVGGGDRGDPASDADGSGQCFLTDNVDGNSDVDGGSTTLTSPIIDMSGVSGEKVVSYQRWYSNDFGNAPEEDIFEVEVSNNGGTSWVPLETVGPSGTEVRGGWFKKSFNVSDFIQPTSQMRFRFTASDLGSGSVVEAAVDDFKVLAVQCTYVVPPDSLTVVSGETLAGQVTDLAESDDQKIRMRSPRRLGLDLIFEVSAISPVANPGNMSITYEASVARNKDPIYQVIEVYNFDTGSFEEVDRRLASTTVDGVTELPLSGDLSRYVDPGSGAVRARVTFDRVFTFATLRLKGRSDQFVWTISE